MLDIRYFGIDKNGKYLPQIMLADEIKDLLQEYQIGGVVLFRENLENKEQIKRLTSELQYLNYQMYAQSKEQELPMLIATDEEGGIVSRIGIDTIGNMALGALNDTNITRDNAILIGYELHKLGINFNFAPVVDINSNQHNPIIGVRSFGDDPEFVTLHAKAFIEGLQYAGIISCAKHFPGHGDTATDTHLGTTVLNKSKDKIKQCELYPYTRLIKDNLLDVVMTAHIVVPDFDDSKILVKNEPISTPSTFSYEILTNILRKNMNFKGVIVTDALDMEAISNSFDDVSATINSIKAGCDVILMPVRIWDQDGIGKFKDYFEQLYAKCQTDIDLQNRVKESYQKIITLKNKLLKNQVDGKVVSDLRFRGNIKNGTFCHLHSGNNQCNTQYELAKKAVTLYKNLANHIPFKIKHSSNILIIADKNNLLEAAYQEAKDLAAKIYHVGQNPNFEKILLDYQSIDIDQLKLLLSKYSQIIVLTYNLQENNYIRNDHKNSKESKNTTDCGETNNMDKLFAKLNETQIPYVMLSCRNPYDINFTPSSTTNILIYGVTGFDQTNYKIMPFTLNLKAVLDKILRMDHPDTYNKFSPVTI